MLARIRNQFHHVIDIVPTLLETFGVDESFDIGSDTGTGVEDKDYQPPFAFNGALSKVTIKLEPVQMSPEEQKAAQDTVGKRD